MINIKAEGIVYETSEVKIEKGIVTFKHNRIEKIIPINKIDCIDYNEYGVHKGNSGDLIIIRELWKRTKMTWEELGRKIYDIVADEYYPSYKEKVGEIMEQFERFESGKECKNEI